MWRRTGGLVRPRECVCVPALALTRPHTNVRASERVRRVGKVLPLFNQFFRNGSSVICHMFFMTFVAPFSQASPRRESDNLCHIQKGIGVIRPALSNYDNVWTKMGVSVSATLCFNLGVIVK